MTFASVPALEAQPDLAAAWLPKITAKIYDPRNVPADQKQGVTIGMAMTEKQGGSDVRANTTRAIPVGAEGPGKPYELVGHKFFVSAPMCDAFLVLAQAPGGLSCFLVPRWRPDGTKNPLQIVRLKRKMGNVSNASSETELRGALGWMVGREGRGVATIIEMVAMTRFDCMIGSSAGMRMAVSQAIDHCRQRKAFGALLIDQPIMTAVLADLAIEAEAALTLTMRIGRALDHRNDPHEDALARLGTAIGKYWICKRAPGHAYEALECVGGSGVMEDSPMPRLYREAPVNAIWEGSGNVQCLDIARAISRSPETLQVYFAEVSVGERRKRDARRACGGAEGQRARSFRFREPRAGSLRPAGGRTRSRGADPRRISRRGRVLPLAARVARDAQLRGADRRRRQGDRQTRRRALDPEAQRRGLRLNVAVSAEETGPACPNRFWRQAGRGGEGARDHSSERSRVNAVTVIAVTLFDERPCFNVIQRSVARYFYVYSRTG